jgi:hypothetical protein
MPEPLRIAAIAYDNFEFEFILTIPSLKKSYLPGAFATRPLVLFNPGACCWFYVRATLPEASKTRDVSAQQAIQALIAQL